MAAWRLSTGAPGLAVGVVLDRTIVFSEGVGFRDLEGRLPVTAETRFRVASVTKPVTAATVFRLVEAGRMTLDESIRTHCPTFPEKSPATPTVRHLLAHQSGLPHTTDAEDTTITGAFTRATEAVPYYADKPLAFAPGSATLYTSWGYALLGCAIEGATGRTYEGVVKEDVLHRAGLRHAEFDTPDFSAPDFSPGYRPGRLFGLRPSLVVDTRFKMPASGLVISTADLLRFAVALSGDGLLGAASRDAMFEPTGPAHQATRYTLGWQAAASRAGARAVVQTGSMEGVTALLFLVPSRGQGVTILANRERVVPEAVLLLRGIADRFFDR
jgi:CubicO group peptidase (beta-lactamase class C family)